MARSAAFCRPTPAIESLWGYCWALIRWHCGTNGPPTSTSALAMLWAHCGCFCQLLTRWLGCLGLRFAGSTHPPATTLPSPLLPTHPLIHDTRDITETFQKTFTKPVILTSCQLVYIMLAITLVYYWSKSGVATIKHQRNIVP